MKKDKVAQYILFKNQV